MTPNHFCWNLGPRPPRRKDMRKGCEMLRHHPVVEDWDEVRWHYQSRLSYRKNPGVLGRDAVAETEILRIRYSVRVLRMELPLRRLTLAVGVDRKWHRHTNWCPRGSGGKDWGSSSCNNMGAERTRWSMWLTSGMWSLAINILTKTCAGGSTRRDADFTQVDQYSLTYVHV